MKLITVSTFCSQVKKSLMTKSDEVDNNSLKERRLKRHVAKSRGRRAATARKDRLWDFGIIPYDIEANFTGK